MISYYSFIKFKTDIKKTYPSDVFSFSSLKLSRQRSLESTLLLHFSLLKCDCDTSHRQHHILWSFTGRIVIMQWCTSYLYILSIHFIHTHLVVFVFSFSFSQ